MKIIISVIVIVFLLFLLLLLIKSNYTTETFITKKDLDEIKKYKGKVSDTYDTIDNPIEDNLLPNNPNDKIKLNEYEIIEIYKNIVERPPTIQEMKKHAYFSNSELREILYNSPEYDKLIKTQNNDVNNGIEGAIAKRNIINRIIEMYSKIYKNELPVKMMTPLRDCFIHLQLNEYLFIAMLESLNYKKFEVDVLSTYVLTKKILLELFNKHFNVLELKLVAQDKINAVNNKNIDFSKELDSIKKDILSIADNDLVNTIKNSFPNVFNEIIKSTIKDDFVDQSTMSNIKTTPNKTDIDLLNQYLKSVEKFIPEKEKEEKKEIKEELTINNNTNKAIAALPENSELYVRVYNPVKRNTTYSNIPDGYKPPICTTLGQDTLTQPVFTQSKLLFQGTDLNDAFEKSQIGSIMPKFIFKEYNDIKIN